MPSPQPSRWAAIWRQLETRRRIAGYSPHLATTAASIGFSIGSDSMIRHRTRTAALVRRISSGWMVNLSPIQIGRVVNQTILMATNTGLRCIQPMLPEVRATAQLPPAHGTTFPMTVTLTKTIRREIILARFMAWSKWCRKNNGRCNRRSHGATCHQAAGLTDHVWDFF